MRNVFLFGIVSMLAACSSPSTVTTPGAVDPGTPLDPGKGGNGDTNPNGVAYPTSNLGHDVGTRIRNLKFVGYKAADPTAPVANSGATTTIQLADFYNPDGKNGNYKVIHLSAASRWCGPCNEETSAVSGYDYQTNTRTGTGVAADLASLGVVFVQALVDGFTPGTSATTNDLQGWINDHESNFTEVLDPGPTAFASFFTGAAVPWNADVDARSMQILKTELGYSPTLANDIKAQVNWVNAHPAMAN